MPRDSHLSEQYRLSGALLTRYATPLAGPGWPGSPLLECYILDGLQVQRMRVCRSGNGAGNAGEGATRFLYHRR